MKKFMVVLGLLALVVSARAETDSKALKRIDDIVKGDEILTNIRTDDQTVRDDLVVADQLTVSNDLTVVDDAVVTDDLRVGGSVVLGNDGNANITSNWNPVVDMPAQVTATNTYTISAVWPTYFLANTTSTVSNNVNIANAPGGAGQLLRIVSVSSNNFWFGDATNIDMGAAYLMGTNDTLSLLFKGNQWVEVSRSNN